MASRRPRTPHGQDSDRRRIGVMMHNWHGGQGDPIYAVGSYYYSGKKHPSVETTQWALSNVEALLAHRRSAEDREELLEIKAFLEQELAHAYRHHNPVDEEHVEIASVVEAPGGELVLHHEPVHPPKPPAIRMRHRVSGHVEHHHYLKGDGWCRVCHDRLPPGEVVCPRHEAPVTEGDARGGNPVTWDEIQVRAEPGSRGYEVLSYGRRGGGFEPVGLRFTFVGREKAVAKTQDLARTYAPLAQRVSVFVDGHKTDSRLANPTRRRCPHGGNPHTCGQCLAYQQGIMDADDPDYDTREEGDEEPLRSCVKCGAPERLTATGYSNIAPYSGVCVDCTNTGYGLRGDGRRRGNPAGHFLDVVVGEMDTIFLDGDPIACVGDGNASWVDVEAGTMLRLHWHDRVYGSAPIAYGTGRPMAVRLTSRPRPHHGHDHGREHHGHRH
jgi:hypothetical protein